MDFDEMSKDELVRQVKRLAGGGLGGARAYNELNELDERDPDEIKDGYQLRFIGKDYARLQASQQTETVLVPNVAHNQAEGNKNSQNIFITGDNLDALKHLENSYSGKVDVIYIDPPYNTGSDGFVYKDNFRYSDDELKLKLGLTDNEVERIRNLEGKSSHSAWLTFMYPRLRIAKRLLSDSGVIIIHIDNNEHANLKILCNEIFQESNYVGEYVWHKKITGGYDNKNINTQHEYILVYAKRYDTDILLPETRESQYKLIDEKGKKYKWDSLWNVGGLTYSKSLDYAIIAPDGSEIWPVGEKGVAFWLWSKEKVAKDREKLRFEKNKKGEWRVYKRIYASEGIVSGSMLDKEVVKGNTHSSAEIKDLFNGIKPFDYTKPTTLAKYLLSRPQSHKNLIALDFFAGSATTGDAVMQLNAEDGGNRKYILVQLDEKVANGSEAEKQGYKTIDQISRKRLEKASAKIRADKGGKLHADFDGGFKHYTLATTSEMTLDKLDAFDPGVLLPDDMSAVFDGESLGVGGGASGDDTLLATWLIDDGFGLNADVEELEFAGAKAYRAENRLYMLDNLWSQASTAELLNAIGKDELPITSVVIYAYALNFETMRELKVNLKTNLEQTIEIIERF